jgi:tetratricopeptide repeat protein
VGLLRGSFRPAAAIAVLRAYLRHRETLMERGHEAWCLRLLGEIASRSGRPKDAEIHFREAIAAAEEDATALSMFTALGMRPWPSVQD